jgi:hypothetical protein
VGLEREGGGREGRGACGARRGLLEVSLVQEKTEGKNLLKGPNDALRRLGPCCVYSACFQALVAFVGV